MYSESELLTACREESSKAQAFLYDQYKALVMKICLRYGNREDSKDIFQECFIQIFDSLKKYREIKDLDRWISRICINTNVRHFHKEQRLQYSDDPIITFDESHKLILETIDTEHLLSILQELPDGYRIVFNMYIIDGYSHQEIAKALGISENTSRSQLGKAKKVLRKRLEEIRIYKYEAS